MAIGTLGYPNTDSWVGYAEESTFGTAITDGSNFQILKIAGDVPSFNKAQFTDNALKNQAKNIVDINDHFATTNGQWQTYDIPEFIAASDDLANFLYAATQTVSEAVGSPFLKTYTMDGTTNPNFASNAGYFFTLLVKSPMASFSQKLTSCVMQSLTIRFDKAENGGRCMVSGTAISGKGFTGTSNPSGTNSLSTVAVPNAHNSVAETLTIGGTSMVWYSVEYNINNVFDFTGYDTGNADNYSLIRQEVTGTARVKYDANSDTLLNGKGATAGAFVHTIDANTTVGYFTFTCNDAWLTDAVVDRGGGDRAQGIDLSFIFSNDYANTQNLVWEVVDGVDQAW